jgi:hypothetical protein
MATSESLVITTKPLPYLPHIAVASVGYVLFAYAAVPNSESPQHEMSIRAIDDRETAHGSDHLQGDRRVDPNCR